MPECWPNLGSRFNVCGSLFRQARLPLFLDKDFPGFQSTQRQPIGSGHASSLTLADANLPDSVKALKPHYPKSLSHLKANLCYTNSITQPGRPDR